MSFGGMAVETAIVQNQIVKSINDTNWVLHSRRKVSDERETEPTYFV